MLPLGRRLHAAGYTVSAPLLAGHGTTPEDLQHSGPDEWLLSAQAALDELVSRCEQVAVGGLSLGSALSIQLAATRPDRVRAALLMGTPFALSIPLGALLFLYTVTPAVWLWPFFPKLDEKHELRDPAFRGLNPAYPVMPMRSGRKLLSYLSSGHGYIRSLPELGGKGSPEEFPGVTKVCSGTKISFKEMAHKPVTLSRSTKRR